MPPEYKSVQVFRETWEMLTRIVDTTGATRNRIIHRLVKQEYERLFGPANVASNVASAKTDTPDTAS